MISVHMQYDFSEKYPNGLAQFVWAYSYRHLKYLSAFLKVGTENQKCILILGHEWLNLTVFLKSDLYTPPSYCKTNQTFSRAPGKKNSLSQAKMMQLTWPMEQSDLWRGWEKAEKGWLLWTPGQLQLSYIAQMHLPMHNGPQETGMLAHVSSGAEPRPKSCA